MKFQENQPSGGVVFRRGQVFGGGGGRMSKLRDIAKRDAFRNIVKAPKRILRELQR